MEVVGIIRWGLEFLGVIPKTGHVTQFVVDHPDRESMASDRVYVVGDRAFQKWATFRCPCGCGDTIMLSLSQKRRPSWTVVSDWLGRPTLDPSVRQTGGCYSHFWLRRGSIEWCADTGKSPLGGK